MLAKTKAYLEDKLGYEVDITIVARVPKSESEAVAIKLAREIAEVTDEVTMAPNVSHIIVGPKKNPYFDTNAMVYFWGTKEGS